jgi:hypothetical protein
MIPPFPCLEFYEASAVAKPRCGQRQFLFVTSPAQPAAPCLRGPFPPGAIVVVTLSSPREKFWGAILALMPEGLSLSGIELASLDDLIAMIKDGEPFSPAVVFFPMHRVERMELDLSDAGVPAIAQRFTTRTGLDAAAALMRPELRQAPVPQERP